MHHTLSSYLGCVSCALQAYGSIIHAQDSVDSAYIPNASSDSTLLTTLLDSSQRTPLSATSKQELRARKSAQKAQADFESLRQRNLPRYSSGSNQDACDERIGRFCYWHREGDSIVAEPQRISFAREQLIDRFEQLANTAPRDDWIAGQRVRYLIEAGYDSSALLAVRNCQGTSSWCHALRAMALHAMQRYSDAELEFETAVNSMSQQERCIWNDISLLLLDEEREAYRRIPCGARDSFEARFWGLSDPSYAIEGNDRKTEHFFRMAMARILSESQNAYGMSWGADMREIMIRYGVPISYTTNWATYISQPAPITGYEREPCFHFTAHNITSNNIRWDLRGERSRERYSPPYIDSIIEIPAQFAMFKRGDSALVVVAYKPSDVTAAVLGGQSTEIQNPQSDTAQLSHSNHRVKYATSEWKGIAVGIEQFTPNTRRIARHRTWIAPPKRISDAPELSTLLLFEPPDTSSLDAALNRALTGNELRGIKQIGVYWEIYHSPSDSVTTSLPVSITITRTDGNFGRWLAQKLRFQHPDQPIELGWREASGVAGTSYRSIILDLAQLPRGTYQIEVSVGNEDSPRTTASREIRLR